MDKLKEIDVKAGMEFGSFDKIISKDRKLLFTSYLGVISDTYNDFYDELDQQTDIYNLTEVLYIGSDFINDLPEAVLKFKKLKHIFADGCRFWDLDMMHVPCSVKIVDILISDFLICL